MENVNGIGIRMPFEFDEIWFNFIYKLAYSEKERGVNDFWLYLVLFYRKKMCVEMPLFG